MKELLLAYDEKTKEFVTLGEISDFEITTESKSDDSQEAWRLKDPFSCSLILDCKINGYVWRALAGLDSNNDRRRHHVPMRKQGRQKARTAIIAMTDKEVKEYIDLAIKRSIKE